MLLNISRTRAIGIFLVFASSLLFLHYAPFSPTFIFRDAAFIYSFVLLSVVWAIPIFVWAAGKITGSDSDVWVTGIPSLHNKAAQKQADTTADINTGRVNG